jgi:TerC family integral membrane protein
MHAAVSPVIWIVTVVVLIAVIVFDLLVIGRRQREVTTKDAAIWIGIYVTLAAVFAVLLFVFAGPASGSEFVAGYITEYSLSIDNLFVFVIIMAKFAVPPLAQDKALYICIILSLLLRTVFILAGAAAIAAASWVFYILGAFLIYTAVRLALEGENDEGDFKENAVLRWLRRILPISKDFDGGKLVTRVDGKKLLTPTVIVIIAIGMANVIFALDSLPAIFGLTTDPYIIFTANALALMGLRQLYFIIGKLLERIIFLKALHASGIDQLGGVELPEIGIPPSLGFIVGVLAITTVVSLIKSGIDRKREIAPD